MTKEFSLTYRDTSLNLRVHDSADVTEALAFVGNHFERRDCLKGDAVATIDVHPLAWLPDADKGESIFVRKSASQFFTIPAIHSESAPGIETVFCSRTATLFQFDRVAKTIQVNVGSAGQLDFIELLRDLVLKDQENRGAAVLHATSAVRDGRAVLIAGLKGAGKSTLLLELVEHHGYAILSGDKTLAHRLPDGRVVVSGWPDYPHLGYGTINKYPDLRAIAQLDDDYVPDPNHAFSPLGKFAIDPTAFRRRFPSALAGTSAEVEAILLPQIGPGTETSFVRVEWGDREFAARHLAELDESPFSGTHASWHSFIEESFGLATSPVRVGILQSLADVPAWRVHGPGDVTTLPWTSSDRHV